MMEFKYPWHIGGTQKFLLYDHITAPKCSVECWDHKQKLKYEGTKAITQISSLIWQMTRSVGSGSAYKNLPQMTQPIRREKAEDLSSSPIAFY